MKAMILENSCDLSLVDRPLRERDLPPPGLTAEEVLIEVTASGVCHTELDEIEGRMPPACLPMVLGHQVVGTVIERGPSVRTPSIGDRVGVGWIASACGTCAQCTNGFENLCRHFRATGRDVPGGYSELIAAKAEFVVLIPDGISDLHAAPLLCAGAIGYRSLQLTGLRDGQRLGLTGFGASAHLVLQMARIRYPNSPVSVFARSEAERAFARVLGAEWTGDTRARAPEPLVAIIDTTPAWTPVVEALANLEPGGRLVVNAIRKEEADKAALEHLDYPSQLWMEKELKSVANVTRADLRDCLALAARGNIRPEIKAYPLASANQALIDLKRKSLPGAKVLLMEPT
jgi:propanol-preferring alcohol dehydrogenase